MGSSDRSVPAVSVDAWTKDVEAVVRHLGLQRFALYGSDIGAAIAITYASKHPEEVSHLILLRPWRSWPQRGAAAIHVVHSLRPQNDQEWAAASKFIASMATGFHADSDEVAEVDSAIQEACDYEQYNRYMNAHEHVDLTGVLPSLEVPTMVLHIPGMVLSTYEDSRDVAANINDARLVEYNPPHTFSILFDFLREPAKEPTPGVPPHHGISGLSGREAEVLRLVAAGKSNQQIAGELVISPNTVAKHVTSILTKTGAANRTEAAVYARDRGLA
jgi:DNA-binding NarL/FixJ family response regulator